MSHTSGENSDEPDEYSFKLNVFHLDSYITKPHLIYDGTYSGYRKCNIDLVTVVRAFGCTDDGIKTCVHIHQYYSHLSIRRRDLVEAYGIDPEGDTDTTNRILDSTVRNIEQELCRSVDSHRADQNQENQIFIVDVEERCSFSFFGYHHEPEIFYRFYFNCYWMANKAKSLLENGLICNHPITCYNFLEFMLQFYIDNRIYLNEIHFKRVTFRKPHKYGQTTGSQKSSQSSSGRFSSLQTRKLRSKTKVLQYNDLPGMTTCSLECDAMIEEIIFPKQHQAFPVNKIFNPTLPGIVKLWNNIYNRSRDEFSELLKALNKPEDYIPPDNESGLNLFLRKILFEPQHGVIPQLDGMDDSPRPGPSTTLSSNAKLICHFRNKKIELSPDKIKNGFIRVPRLATEDLLGAIGPLKLAQDKTKLEFLHSVEERIKKFTRPQWYLNRLKLRTKIRPIRSAFKVDPISGKLCLFFPKPRAKLHHHSTPNSDISFNKSMLAKKLLRATKPLPESRKRLFGDLDSTIVMPKNFLLPASERSNSLLNLSDSSSTRDESFDRLDGMFRWSQCLNLGVMSLEVHAQIRGNLTSDPAIDPIQIVVFCLYEEFLRDHLDSNEKSAQENSNIQHFGAIVVRPDAETMPREIIRIKCRHITVEYVRWELDLFARLSHYVRHFDPDILLGWIIDTFSWGYLLQRAAVLDLDFGSMFSRICDPYRSGKRNSPGALNEPPQLIGRIILNGWKLLRKEINLRSYSFETVHQHLFNETVARFPNELLNQLWTKHVSSTGKKRGIFTYFLLEYYFKRTVGSIKILAHLNLIRRTYDLSCLFGMQFQDVIDRGTQFRVECMLFPLCRDENFLPIRFPQEQIKNQRSPQCVPLIFEPDPTFHRDPVAVFDFQSLYPSIMIAYNYCFSTCLGRLQNVFSKNNGPIPLGCHNLQIDDSVFQRLKNDLHISPTQVLFVKQNIRRGLLPRMLEELLSTRILIKRELKNVGKKLKKEPENHQVRKRLESLRRQLDVFQLGLKLISNVTYGYTSANFSGRMPCVEIADSIVSKGREALEEVVEFVNQWGRDTGTNASVIYGDTDSLFIKFPGHSLDVAFEMASYILEEINKRQPYPMCLKLEKIYQPCILMAKKRYCGNAYETPDSKPWFDAKGIETVRRDSCPMTAKIVEKCIQILFETPDIRQLESYLRWQFKKLLSGRVGDLADYIFAKEFHGFKNYVNESVIPACIVARKRMEIDRRMEPKFKERVPYVIICGDSQRLADLVREPLELLRDERLQLNGEYYIKRVFIPPLIRVLDSLKDVGTDTRGLLESWYNETEQKCRQNRPLLNVASKLFRCHNSNNKNFKPDDLAKLWKMNTGTGNNSNESNIELQKPAVIIGDSMWISGQRFKRIESQCSKCSMMDIRILFSLSENGRHQCIRENCANLYRFHQTERELRSLAFLDRILSQVYYFSKKKTGDRSPELL